jgi:hypothetical protein
MLQHNCSEQRPLILDLTDEETDQVGGGSLIVAVGLTVAYIYVVNRYARVEHW